MAFKFQSFSELKSVSLIAMTYLTLFRSKLDLKWLTFNIFQVQCGRMLTSREKMHAVDSDTTTESDKTRGNTRLLLFSIKNKSLVLTIMGCINTPLPKCELVLASMPKL